MRITAFNGSPRAEKGNTHVMVSEFLEGCKEAGAEAENIFLVRKEIKPCNGCYACWMETPGECAHDDDMEELLNEHYYASDIVVFATPVYVDNVTGIMKMFIDRLIATGDPHMEKDEHGECRHIKKHENPSKIAVISNCGFPEQSHFQVLRLLFARMARNLQCELSAEIYRGGGGLLTAPIPELKPFVENYKTLLRQAGQEFVRRSRLSPQTIASLEAPLLPMPDFVDQYIVRVNQRVDAILARQD
ncbi:MAG: flavodoxin family protein [Candidatus Omnitrophota bacterium]